MPSTSFITRQLTNHLHILACNWSHTDLDELVFLWSLSNTSWKLQLALQKHSQSVTNSSVLSIPTSNHCTQCQQRALKGSCALILHRKPWPLAAWKETESEAQLHHCLKWNWVNANTRWLSHRNTLPSLWLSWWSNQLLKYYWMMPCKIHKTLKEYLWRLEAQIWMSLSAEAAA